MNKQAQMPETRLGGAVKLFLLFALEIGFIALLHWLGSIDKLAVDFSQLKVWIDTTPPEIALAASIRILALGFAYWVLGTSLLYMVARAFHIPFLIRALELTTVPGVRRVIDAGLAAAIIGGTVFGGAGAVFAKTQTAQESLQGQAGITASYKETRVLFNPNAVGDNSGPTVILPSVADNTSGKVVVASTDTDASATQTPVKFNPPEKDANGNFLPTPADGPNTTGVQNTDIITQPAQNPTGNQKVVVEPTPADSTPTAPTTAPTTTAPKVTVAPTTPPVVSTPPPSVDVGGKVVERPDTPAPAAPTNPSSYTVVSGDNFWAIARTQVQNSLGREPTNTEVANYWVKLIEANKGNIRSGDPDLIFPGEVFTLPPL